MLYNYISNNFIKSVVDELVANPQNNIRIVNSDQGRIWSLTNGRSFGIEENGQTSLVEKILNAVILFFKYWSSTFRANFNYAIREINDAVSSYPMGEAPAQTLQKDVIRSNLMSLLSLRDCAAMARVCKQWKNFIQPELGNHHLSEVIFGKKQWEDIPGIYDVGEEPVLSDDQKARLITKLKRCCPYFNQPDNIQPHRFCGKTNNKFWNTFKIILIPEKINGQPVDMDLIGDLFRFEKNKKDPNWVNQQTVFDYINWNVNSDRPMKNKFLIVSKDVLPGSRGTRYEKKVELVLAEGFRVPKPLEALIMNVVLNIGPSKEGKGYFFGKKGGQHWTFMVTDTMDDDGFDISFVCVGAACSDGLQVRKSPIDDVMKFKSIGMAAVAEISEFIDHE
jgi:hypothetical protein